MCYLKKLLASLGTLRGLHTYLIIQRHWMYDTNKEVSTFSTFLLTVCNPVKTMVLAKTSVDFKTYHRMFVVEI